MSELEPSYHGWCDRRSNGGVVDAQRAFRKFYSAAYIAHKSLGICELQAKRAPATPCGISGRVLRISL